MFRAVVWHPKSNIIKFETGWRNSAAACKGEVESKILELAWDGYLDLLGEPPASQKAPETPEGSSMPEGA